MGLYEVLLRQTYFAQEVINRFHYSSPRDALTTLTSAALADVLGFSSLTAGEFADGTLAKAIQTIQNTEVFYGELQVKNLYSATDFFTVAFNPTPHGDGAIGGDHASPAFAYGFISNRTTLAVRAGHKRFAGVAEAGMNSGGVVNDAGGTLADLATALGTVYNYTDGLSSLPFSPVILGFHEYTTPKGNKAYKPWDTEAEQRDHMASGITYTLMPDVRTQRSRQYGRGR